jgi:hypothetical protein
MGQYAAARAAFAKMLELKPGLMSYNRNLVRSLQFAQADFEVRQDVYTYDALSWALFKNQRFQKASRASAEALFFYHAGMIANSLGKRPSPGIP